MSVTHTTIAAGKGDYRTAIELLKQASEADPDEGGIYSELGDVYYNCNDYKSAIQSYNRAMGCLLTEGQRKHIAEAMQQIVSQRPNH